jgi:hypothetical protein
MAHNITGVTGIFFISSALLGSTCDYAEGERCGGGHPYLRLEG